MEQLKADAANTAAKIVAEMSRYAPPAGRHNADPFATLKEVGACLHRHAL